MDPRLVLCVALTAASMSSGCATGPEPREFRPAVTPAGIFVELRVRSGGIGGELLEVRDSGLVVLQRPRIVLVPFAAIRQSKFAQTSLGYHHGTPSPTARERMRLVSRFPQGMSSEQLARLLASLGQQTMEVYTP